MPVAGEKFVGLGAASSRGSDMYLRERTGQAAAGSAAVEDVTTNHDGAAKATQQSPRWQDASPRGPPLVSYSYLYCPKGLKGIFARNHCIPSQPSLYQRDAL